MGCHNVTSPDSPRYHEVEVCPGGREITIDSEADSENVYEKEVWLPDVPGEGRYVWMIRSNVSIDGDEDVSASS